MAIRSFARVAAGVALLGGGGVAAGALGVIDQQSTTNTSFTTTVLPALGQSFTPTLNAIDFATFVISDTNPSTYKVEVYEGAGFGGTLLGTSETNPVALAPEPLPGAPITEDNAQPVDFEFPSSVALTPGNLYTLRVVQVSGAGGLLFLRVGLNNPYAGGTAYDVGPLASLDFVFAEGIVPEPGSVAGLGAGGMVLLASRRRGGRRIG